jgi:RNA polymerase sigma-70 factor (ECF subfamily)
VEATLIAGIPGAVLNDPFDEVVRAREGQVLRTAYRMLGNWADAEDVAQEVFFRLHRHGMDFANDAVVGSWLYRVTVNLCIDRTRRRRPSEELRELPAGGPTPEAAAERGQQKRRLMAALAMLPPRERAAIVLREIEGSTTAEVAAALGTAEVTIRSQVAKALVRLRELMSREETP